MWVFELFELNKDMILKFKDTFVKSKKFWLIYLIFISITFLSVISQKNLEHPKLEIILFAFLAILGVFCIVYYFLHDSDKELFKVAFIIILCFGIICSFIVPIVDVSDEVEHLTRAELTSQGVLIPHWTGDDIGIDRLYNHSEEEFSNELNKGIGYETIQSIDFFYKNREVTIFDTNHDTDKINTSICIKGSAFEQNPFYGYLPQAIGILIAKLLDLNVIWLLWLGRICNLICYAGLISLAIKITPKFKMPLLAVACIPITIYQAASVSIDSMIFGLGILAVAYFIHLCYLNDVSLKEIILFSVLSLLLGLCKLPYLAFIFLLLFIPRKNFTKTNFYWVILSIIVVGLIGILYSKYSTPALMHSWRSSYNYINSTFQLNYLINNPIQIIEFFKQIFTSDLGYVVNGVFNFFNGKLGAHYQDNYVFITLCLQIFLAMILFAYPSDDEIEPKTKIGALIVLLIIYIGTCFIQLLTWSYVGEMRLGISVRYFIPLFALIPLIVPHWDYYPQETFNKYVFVFIVAFMATLLLSFVTKYY
ncbi:MAG: DUF2142 domain-containing protein [Methanobrevibacter sp.]|nr:DUF2142 domain-containing protein [Methanobrevibacter sp.]